MPSKVFFSQNHTENNSDDWTITKKTTRTIKHENFSKMKILKVDRWALSLTTPGCCVSFQIRLSQLIWDFKDLKFGRSRVQIVCWGSETAEKFGTGPCYCHIMRSPFPQQVTLATKMINHTHMVTMVCGNMTFSISFYFVGGGGWRWGRD